MKFYSLYVCDTRELMEVSVEAMRAMTFNHEEEVFNCPLNVELRALLADGKSEDEIYAAICAHHEEGPYDLFWSVVIFSPITRLSNEQHQAIVVKRLIENYPNQWRNLVFALQLHPAAKAIVDAALA